MRANVRRGVSRAMREACALAAPARALGTTLNVAAPSAPTHASSVTRAVALAPTRGFAASANDTHDDFKPKRGAANGANVKDMIESDVRSNAVLIYMKGSPSAPQCGFSNMACRILDHHGVEYASRNVLASDELRNGIKEYSSWPTIPQLYVNGEFVGGSDIMMNMHQSGELAELFKDVKKR